MKVWNLLEITFVLDRKQFIITEFLWCIWLLSDKLNEVVGPRDLNGPYRNLHMFHEVNEMQVNEQSIKFVNGWFIPHWGSHFGAASFIAILRTVHYQEKSKYFSIIVWNFEQFPGRKCAPYCALHTLVINHHNKFNLNLIYNQSKRPWEFTCIRWVTGYKPYNMFHYR